MFCKFCGAENKASNKFCLKCGAPMQNVEPQSNQIFPTVMTSPLAVYGYKSSLTSEPMLKKKMNTYSVLSILGILLSVLSFLLPMLSMRKLLNELFVLGETVSNTTSNLRNLSFFDLFEHFTDSGVVLILPIVFLVANFIFSILKIDYGMLITSALCGVFYGWVCLAINIAEDNRLFLFYKFGIGFYIFIVSILVQLVASCLLSSAKKQLKEYVKNVKMQNSRNLTGAYLYQQNNINNI